MRKNKKLLMVMSIVLSAMTLVFAATFAWFTQSENKLNQLKTRLLTGGVSIFEDFNEPDPETGGWLPGTDIKKEVGVINTGEVTVLVRVSFEELLQKLSAPVGATGTALYNGEVTKVPGLVNTAAYTAGGWKKLNDAANFGAGMEFTTVNGTITTLAALNGATGLNGIDVYYTFANGKYEFVAWKQIGTHTPSATVTDAFDNKYQKVDIAFTVAGTALTYTPANVKYWEGALGAAANYKWANFPMDLMRGADVSNPNGLAPWNTAFAAGNIRPSSAFTGSPFSLIPYTDLTANGGHDYIKLNFSANLIAAMTADNWYYNANDGWFYYMGALPSGNATPLLLSSLSLNKSAAGSDSLYKYLDFDLDVKMQAIQNLEAAITATDGWDLNNASFAGANAALITQLKTYCSDHV